MSSRSKKMDLKKIRKVLNVKEPEEKQVLTAREILIKTQGKDPYLCPKCQMESMVVVKIIHGARGSPIRFFAKDKKIMLEE